MFFLHVMNCVMPQKLTRYAATDEDCKRGYRDLNRNLRGSSALDMVRNALSRLQCGGNMLNGLEVGIGHMQLRSYRYQ